MVDLAAYEGWLVSRSRVLASIFAHVEQIDAYQDLALMMLETANPSTKVVWLRALQKELRVHAKQLPVLPWHVSDFVDDTDPSWSADAVDWLGCHLTPNQTTITVMLLSGNTHSEIATSLGCHRQTITAMVADIRTKAKKENLPHEIKDIPS